MFWYILHFSSLYKFDFVGCIWCQLEDCVQIYHYLWEINFLWIACSFLYKNVLVDPFFPQRILGLQCCLLILLPQISVLFVLNFFCPSLGAPTLLFLPWWLESTTLGLEVLKFLTVSPQCFKPIYNPHQCDAFGDFVFCILIWCVSSWVFVIKNSCCCYMIITKAFFLMWNI